MTPSNTAFRITVPASASFTHPQSNHCGLHDINKSRLPLLLQD